MRGLLLAAFVEAGIITWRDLSKDKVLPLPSDYVAVAIYFGMLGLLPSSASTVAGALGWGMVVATFLNLFDPTKPTALIFPGQSGQVQGGPQANVPATSAPSAVPVNPATGLPQGVTIGPGGSIKG